MILILEDRITELKQILRGLIDECKYSVSSDLSFKESWTQLNLAVKILKEDEDEVRSNIR